MERKLIDGKLENTDSTSELIKQSADEISHLAIDIGGSLIKIVYFSTNSKCSTNDEAPTLPKERQEVPNGDLNHHILSGRLHFVKFETSKIEDCINFLSSKKLQQCGAQCHHSHTVDKIKIKATGGGAFKFADLFKEKLGITLDKVEEMESLVAGANFLLKAVNHEAYTYIGGRKEYMQIDQNDLYPYLLVNIGSGVSMIKVDGDEKFQRVSGTSVGGGTFWGLGKLLTKCKSFDELLELSHEGNNRVIDMLVGDIYGGMDYAKIGLASTAIASSFGKPVSENRELEDYKPEDIARSLLRMISNNIGQIAYLNALRFGLKRIILGGFFIRDHAYTMDTISVAVDFWSKGEAKAMFLRHEGFLGALGAFMNYKDGNADLMPLQLVEQTPKSSSCIVDRIHNSTRVHENESGAIDCRLRVSSSFKIYDEVKRC
ncbi:pantothenate kinase 1 [Nicotiana tabacum]|uniref:pantothenate kinase n=1 Tax=Nicotiana tabacum TaxID=4097 RepID=A0A1S4DER4_TOBAC|nr:pantothenate kinase 1 [Nicotiana tomentosiformis]XP_016511950.1 PREDICTED: pantothenate kinase 1-like [Nicotiana tabacum]